VIGMLANKQGPDILRALLGPGDHAWIVPVPGHASWSRDQLAAELGDQPLLAAALHQAHDLPQALEAARLPDQQRLPEQQRLVVAGSLYLIAHLLGNRSPAGAGSE
jgi:dihydrofolate synthase/folylpolyglutamate synthase